MKKSYTVIILTLLAVAFTVGAYLDNPYRDLINSDKQLYCELNAGYQKIDKSKIAGLVEDTWIFKNGSAKNCEVR